MKKLLTIAFLITIIFSTFNLCFASVSPECLFDTIEEGYSDFFYPPETTIIRVLDDDTEYYRLYDNEYESGIKAYLDILWIKVNFLDDGEWTAYGTLDNMDQDIANNQCSIERCFGALGSQCEGVVGSIFGSVFGQPPVTAHSEVEVIRDVSVGSILHDNCCVDNPGGYWCGHGDTTPDLCRNEFVIAFKEYDIYQWEHKFGPYDVGEGDDLTVVPPRPSREGLPNDRNERAASLLLRAPNGTKLYIADEAFCESGKFTETNTVLNYGICGEDPIPDIKANGSDGPIDINTGDNLSVTVELDSGDKAGENADWWVVADTPSGLQYFDLSQGFASRLSVIYQGALFDLGSTEILNTSSLDAGTYTYLFGVDLNVNGTLDTGEGQLYYDQVTVTVTANVDKEECVNVSGNWYGTETITLTCCLYGECETETFSGQDTITIEQDGCDINYDIYVSGYGNFSRTGTISGSDIQISGIAAVLQSYCTATQNFVTGSGSVDGDQINLQGTAIIQGTCANMDISCTGNSTAKLTRSKSYSKNNEMDVKATSKPSSQLLDNYLGIFTTISH